MSWKKNLALKARNFIPSVPVMSVVSGGAVGAGVGAFQEDKGDTLRGAAIGALATLPLAIRKGKEIRDVKKALLTSKVYTEQLARKKFLEDLQTLQNKGWKIPKQHQAYIDAQKIIYDHMDSPESMLQNLNEVIRSNYKPAMAGGALMGASGALGVASIRNEIQARGEEMKRREKARQKKLQKQAAVGSITGRDNRSSFVGGTQFPTESSKQQAKRSLDTSTAVGTKGPKLTMSRVKSKIPTIEMPKTTWGTKAKTASNGSPLEQYFETPKGKAELLRHKIASASWECLTDYYTESKKEREDELKTLFDNYKTTKMFL